MYLRCAWIWIKYSHQIGAKFIVKNQLNYVVISLEYLIQSNVWIYHSNWSKQLKKFFSDHIPIERYSMIKKVSFNLNGNGHINDEIRLTCSVMLSLINQKCLDCHHFNWNFNHPLNTHHHHVLRWSSSILVPRGIQLQFNWLSAQKDQFNSKCWLS